MSSSFHRSRVCVNILVFALYSQQHLRHRAFRNFTVKNRFTRVNLSVCKNSQIFTIFISEFTMGNLSSQNAYCTMLFGSCRGQRSRNATFHFAPVLLCDIETLSFSGVLHDVTSEVFKSKALQVAPPQQIHNVNLSEAANQITEGGV